MHRTLFASLIIAVAVGGTMWFLQSEPPPLVPPTLDTTYGLGQIVPDFEFTALTGGTQRMSAYAAGAPLLLVLRDALCPVARRYGHRTSRLDQEYGERGVRFLYLNVSPLDGPDEMEQDVERYGLTSAYTHDHTWEVTRHLKALTTAEVFLLDGDGRLRYRGAIDDQYGIRFSKPAPRRHYLRNALDQLLAGEDIETTGTLAESCYLASDAQTIEHHHNID
jgi:hypothetical protein